MKLPRFPSGVLEFASVADEITPRCEERAQTERLLADSLFSQSKRYGPLLRYVTERALGCNEEPLTERALGVEIFGRPQHYDTDADSIVRVTASELRKRLAQYYGDPAHAGEIRVVIQKGTYLAEFLPPGSRPELVNTAAPQLAANEAAYEPAPEAVPEPAPEPAPERRKTRRWYYIAGLVGACVLIAGGIQMARSPGTVSQQFWKPILSGPRDVLLSIPQFSDHVRLKGVGDPELTWTDTITPTPGTLNFRWEVYSQRLVHMSDVAVAARMSEFLWSKGKHAVWKGEHDLTMRDLRDAPGVIVGGLVNQWTSQLLPRARFTFAGEGSVRFIRDSQHPEKKDWSFDSKIATDDRLKDFIIISRVADSVSGRITVLAGGFSVWGTEAAVQLLTDPEQMEQVLANAPRNWESRNVQIVLECALVRRESGIPRFLAAHFW
jgi:hypothetical protein